MKEQLNVNSKYATNVTLVITTKLKKYEKDFAYYIL